MHPGYFSLYVGIAVLGTLYLGLESYWNKKLLIPILSVFSLGLLLLQGRMTIIALAFSLGLWLIISLVKSKSWKPILIAATIAIGIFTVFYNLAPKSLSERYLAFPDFSYDISGSDFNSATYRLAEWKCAWDGIKDEPLKGYGIGCGQVELFKRYEKFKFWEGLDRQYNAHNQYLETTLNIGFIGLSALLLMLLSIAAMAIKYNNYLMLYALIFFACCLLTESMLERAWAVVLFNLFFPIFINLRKQ
jgi:O-antigen ligase